MLIHNFIYYSICISAAFILFSNSWLSITDPYSSVGLFAEILSVLHCISETVELYEELLGEVFSLYDDDYPHHYRSTSILMFFLTVKGLKLCSWFSPDSNPSWMTLETTYGLINKENIIPLFIIPFYILVTTPVILFHEIVSEWHR